MSKAQRIIIILEGFKLGDLGAGKKNYVEEPEAPFQGREKRPTDRVHSSTWIDDDEVDTRTWLGGVKWIEASGFRFYMCCHEQPDEGKCVFYFAGGINLTVTTIQGDPEVRGTLFDGLLRQRLGRKAGLVMLRGLMENVKTNGSFGRALAFGKLGMVWKISHQKIFDQYIFETAGVHKALTFKYEME